MTKREELERLRNELEGLNQYMTLCGHGVRDIMRKHYLEDQIWELENSDLDEEDTEEETEEEN